MQVASNGSLFLENTQVRHCIQSSNSEQEVGTESGSTRGQCSSGRSDTSNHVIVCTLHFLTIPLAPLLPRFPPLLLSLVLELRLLCKAAVSPQWSVHLPVHQFQRVHILNVIILSRVANVFEVVSVLGVMNLLDLQCVHSGQFVLANRAARFVCISLASSLGLGELYYV